VWKAIVNRDVPRLYVEARAFMKLRGERNRMVKQSKLTKARDTRETVSAGV
jgi:hypothetical protein